MCPLSSWPIIYFACTILNQAVLAAVQINENGVSGLQLLQ